MIDADELVPTVEPVFDSEAASIDVHWLYTSAGEYEADWRGLSMCGKYPAHQWFQRRDWPQNIEDMCIECLRKMIELATSDDQ